MDLKLNIIYVFKNDNFEGKEGIRNLSFSINNICKNIKKSNYSDKIKITLVEECKSLKQQLVSSKLFIEEENLKYINHLLVTNEKNQDFNSCKCFNYAFKNIKSEFSLWLVGRIFFNDLSFFNLLKLIEDSKKSHLYDHDRSLYTINRFFIKKDIENRNDYNFLNNYLNNLEIYPKPNSFYPGLVSGFGALLCKTQILVKENGFDESFWSGMNDIELGYRFSEKYEIISLLSKNIYCFDVNKVQNRTRPNLNIIKKKQKNYTAYQSQIRLANINKNKPKNFESIFSEKKIRKIPLLSMLIGNLKIIKIYETNFDFEHFLLFYLNKILSINFSLIITNEIKDINFIYSASLGNLISKNIFYFNKINLTEELVRSSITVSNLKYKGILKFKKKTNHK